MWQEQLSAPSEPASQPAPKAKFDRVAYQRNYMRDYRKRKKR